MDNLEKYFKNNRDQFDDLEEPSMDSMWRGIRREIKNENLENEEVQSASFFKIRKSYFFAVAASVLLLIGFSIGSIWNSNEVKNELLSLSDISPELAKQEENFKKMIAEKEAEIGLGKLEKEAFKDIFEELDLLEEIQKEYRKDIPEFSQNDQLVNTLIKYYEQKIRILERLSKEIEKFKYHEKHNDEKDI